MTTRNLEYLFGPGSIALIGASERPHSIGATVLRNLFEVGFAGPIWPVISLSTSRRPDSAIIWRARSMIRTGSPI